MTRDEYISYRLDENIGNIAWDFYQENCKNPINYTIFKRMFPIFHIKPVVRNRKRRQLNEPSHITLLIRWAELWEIYDKKFNVNILYTNDTHTKILKIW